VDHVALTLDGAIATRPGEMRWMPPEQAAEHLAAAQAAADRLDRRLNDRGVPITRRPRP
jgi:hypothetical protein